MEKGVSGWRERRINERLSKEDMTEEEGGARVWKLKKGGGKEA